MVCLIADYMENGEDRHRSYIATGTNDDGQAVNALVQLIEGKGGVVRCISIVPGEHSMNELDKIAERPRAGMALVSYRFNEDAFQRYEDEKKKLSGLRGKEYETAVRQLADRMRL